MSKFKKTYLIKNPVPDEEIQFLLSQAFPGKTLKAVNRIRRGSTNLVFDVLVDDREYILKIAHRPDRIRQGVLLKEAKILKKFENQSFPITMPKIFWTGSTLNNMPALVESKLSDKRVEDIIHHNLDIDTAAETLGKFVAELHKHAENKILEFENGRPEFPDFQSFVRYWLLKWRPLCEKATHIAQEQITQAYQTIEASLSLFSEKSWPYVHADISFENLHGKVENNQLILTGLCDFENVQTAPPEYDFATIDDGLFLFYPQMETPFFKSYRQIRPLPQNFKARLIAVNLFRALRYIKRSVKYNETHYFAHDRQYLEKWLNKK